jgi:hypothetical protein
MASTNSINGKARRRVWLLFAALALCVAEGSANVTETTQGNDTAAAAADGKQGEAKVRILSQAFPCCCVAVCVWLRSVS